jgi:hypothetical protein
MRVVSETTKEEITMAQSAKTIATDKPKPKRKAPKTAWKPGQSGNPAGRPKDGQSWKEVISEVSNMTVDDILLMVGENNDLGRAIKQMPKSVQMKYLVTARVMAALMFEPTSGLWMGLMDRMEGKVAERIQVDGNLEVDNLDKVLSLVYGKSEDHSG